MIKINLLPRDLKREEGAKHQTQFAILGVIALICLLLVVYVSKMMVWSKKEKELKTASAELEKMSVLVNAVEEKQRQKEMLDRKWGIIDKLLQGRFRWAMIMDEMNNCIPKSIWLTGMVSTKTDSGNLVSLNGMAFDNFAIADFVTTLDDDPYFDNVELIAISEGGAVSAKDTRTTLNFSITLTSKL
jgi:Tfp pilus assembly protein PilN